MTSAKTATSALSIPIFVAGLLSIPCIVMQPFLPLLAAQMVFSYVWAVANHKRVRPLYFALLIASVALFHVLTPRGEVYFYVWRVPITAGALLFGVRKGMVVVSLVFCSLATVRPDIRLPGRAGALLSTLFVYFDVMFQRRRALRRKTLVADIDRLLYRLYAMPMVGGARSADGAVDAKKRWGREIAVALCFWGGHVGALVVGSVVG